MENGGEICEGFVENAVAVEIVQFVQRRAVVLGEEVINLLYLCRLLCLFYGIFKVVVPEPRVESVVAHQKGPKDRH